MKKLENTDTLSRNSDETMRSELGGGSIARVTAMTPLLSIKRVKKMAKEKQLMYFAEERARDFPSRNICLR